MKTKELDVKITDEAEGKIAAVFSTFNVKDHDGDVTPREAFEDGAAVKISAYNHASWREGHLPVGKGVVRLTDDEAILDGKFFLDTQAGRETFAILKELGELGEWSYGFDVLDQEQGELNGESVNMLKEVKIHEVSPVLLGAGVNTRTLFAKSDSGAKFSQHIEAVVTDLDELTERAADVKAKRLEKGKSLGAESRDLLGKLQLANERLMEVMADGETSEMKIKAALEIERARINTRG